MCGVQRACFTKPSLTCLKASSTMGLSPLPDNKWMTRSQDTKWRLRSSWRSCTHRSYRCCHKLGAPSSARSGASRSETGQEHGTTGHYTIGQQERLLKTGPQVPRSTYRRHVRTQTFMLDYYVTDGEWQVLRFNDYWRGWPGLVRVAPFDV